MFDLFQFASPNGLSIAAGPVADPEGLARLRRGAFPFASEAMDHFDAFATHIVVRSSQSDAILGAMRVIGNEQAARAGGFYTQSEYQCDAFCALSGGHLEMSRVAVAPECDDPRVVFMLFKTARDLARQGQVRFLFGVASYMSGPTPSVLRDVAEIERRFCIGEVWCPETRAPVPLPVVKPEGDAADRALSSPVRPPLVQAFLRAGARVAKGAFYDRDFRTLDIMMIKDRQGAR